MFFLKIKVQSPTFDLRLWTVDFGLLELDQRSYQI